jgi:hypothetical protein
VKEEILEMEDEIYLLERIFYQLKLRTEYING